MRIAVVLPRNVNFGPNGATAIDLCAADFIRFSKFRSETGVFCPPVDEPFEGFNVHQVSTPSSHRKAGQAYTAAIRSERPELVVVHQHLGTASSIARALRSDGIPVILHRHNFAKPPGNAFQQWREKLRYGAFTHIFWPSRATKAPFSDRQPELADRAHVIWNGLDLTQWSPETQRDQTVLFVGRAHTEKGVLEAAHGVARSLAQRPQWRARFIVSFTKDRRAITKDIEAALAPLQGQAQVEKELPFTTVKAAFERAAIALVPSNYNEAFGRTALEAMAGGAALIHSGRGGLSEVAGDAGVTLSAVKPDNIEASVNKLIDDADYRIALVQAAKIQCQQFDIRTSAAALDSIYEAVLNERQGLAQPGFMTRHLPINAILSRLGS